MDPDARPVQSTVLREHTERIDGLLEDAALLKGCGLVADGLQSLLDAKAILGEYTDAEHLLIPYA